MLHRTDMHYYNIEEIGMRNRYYRTAAIKAAVIYLVGTLRKKEKKRRNLIVFARFLWIFARIYSTINERIRTRILLEEELEMKREDMIWSDRKRNWLGLPWTFTVYGLTEDRLFITGYWICPCAGPSGRGSWGWEPSMWTAVTRP